MPFVTRMDLEGILLMIICRILKKKKTELIDTNNRLDEGGMGWEEKWVKSQKVQTPSHKISHGYSNQDSMVPVQKQTYRSMEQDRKPRDKPTHLWAPDL